MEKKKNHLNNETSPYLLQHLYNPVDWHPWSESILKRALDENKLLIISIGYAACHWCHVMEHESFEDEEVADLMNENFISVKVDREERPDIDQIYMNAVQLISGRGGWPLNVIALPNGKPIYAGTYFPKQNWMNLLSQIIKIKNSEFEKLVEQAEEITKGIHRSEIVQLNTAPTEFTDEKVKQAFKSIINTVDFELGGFDRAPKFPMPVVHDFLLKYYYKTGDKNALEAVTITLNTMAAGGIYDQLGGGFARYSVDEKWFAPHFEKMLYDNGQLVSLYSNAYKISKNDIYKDIVFDTIEFVQRELTSHEGGYYSALDADSEGEEGKFYVWTYNEIADLLKENLDIYIDYYNIKKEGNWENENNILYNTLSIELIAEKYNRSIYEIKNIIKSSNKLLFEERSKRIRPQLDDKILTSWNALMLKGIIDAYKAFGNEKHLKLAVDNAQFIKEKMLRDNDRLLRNYKNGQAKINGFLDDYALVIEAFINLYQITFDENWLIISDSLTKYTIKHFFNEENSMFYYTSDTDEKLIARKYEFSDNVIPSSNSVMASNLHLLGIYFQNQEYKNISQQMLRNLMPNLLKDCSFFANWGSLLLLNTYPLNEIAITGSDYKQILNEFNSKYLPTSIFAGSDKDSNLSLLQNRINKNRTMIYVCRDNSCQLPTVSIDEALRQIE